MCSAEAGIALGFASDEVVTGLSAQLYNNITTYLANHITVEVTDVRHKIEEALYYALYELICQIGNMALIGIGFIVGYTYNFTQFRYRFLLLPFFLI